MEPLGRATWRQEGVGAMAHMVRRTSMAGVVFCLLGGTYDLVDTSILAYSPTCNWGSLHQES